MARETAAAAAAQRQIPAELRRLASRSARQAPPPSQVTHRRRRDEGDTCFSQDLAHQLRESANSRRPLRPAPPRAAAHHSLPAAHANPKSQTPRRCPPALRCRTPAARRAALIIRRPGSSCSLLNPPRVGSRARFLGEGGALPVSGWTGGSAAVAAPRGKGRRRCWGPG